MPADLCHRCHMAAMLLLPLLLVANTLLSFLIVRHVYKWFMEHDSRWQLTSSMDDLSFSVFLCCLFLFFFRAS